MTTEETDRGAGGEEAAAGSVSRRISGWWRRLRVPGIVLLGCVSLFFLLILLFPLPRNSLHPPASLQVRDREGGILRVYLSRDEMVCFPVRLDDVSPYLVEATLAYEDRWFYYHPGINPVAIARAAWMNLRAGRVLSGGSTITQQVARLIDPRPRTFSAKAIEAFRALELEVIYNKRQILEFYFNLAPYGGNIVGAAAAAQVYFGKAVSRLGPGEAAMLAALPSAPNRLRPDGDPAAARRRRDEVLRRMLAKGVIDQHHYDLAVSEDVPETRQPFPFIAPHLCDAVYLQRDGRGGDVVTTLDRQTQLLAKRLLTRYIHPLQKRGVHNGAVVIVDNKSGEVRALVGSADYFNRIDAGQVNGALAPRSPGSTLKPFVYAIALNDGLISPSTLLEDIPVDYRGYSPKNYDDRFRGVVRAEDALAHSMNVPAVNLTRRVGLDRLINVLRWGGIGTLPHDGEYYGLPLILGGAGVRLLELTNLYGALANGGVARPVRYYADAPEEAGHRLFSKGAAYIITEMLTRLRRPDFPSNWQQSVHLPRVAWKTGTSYGHRDAWSIGYSPRWTVGVWIGNFSGEGNPLLVGADAAGPLLFDLFDALQGDAQPWFEQPDDVEEREVCALSGLPPGTGCEATRHELALRNISPARTCDLHVRLTIDDATGARLCPHCRVGRSYHEKTYVKWPPAVSSWMQANGMALAAIPQHLRSCPKMLELEAPEIRSPVAECTYVIRDDVPIEDQQILLDASVRSDVRKVYWFVDGDLIYEGSPNKKVFYKPERGRHRVICMDDDGRRGSRLLTIL